MSMSEFERRQAEPDPLNPSSDDKSFPDDFSEADFAFAKELDALFSLEEEEIPPLFAQTLLASEDPRFQSVEGGFEKKTCASVFRQLKLKRRLFRSSRPSMHTLLTSLPRPLVVLGAACMLFMFLSVAVVSPSFASGLDYLWAGAHSGVLQVNHYPNVTPVVSPQADGQSAQNAGIAHPKQLNLMQVQGEWLHFPLLWPQYIPAHYTQGDTYLYKGDPSWADGPIMVMNFYNSSPGVTTKQIAICEFKPQGKVLQVVQDGAAHQIKIGQDGSASAIYVEGQWTQASSPTWIYSDRSQLIYEDTSGVVFWIVGDKRDGIDGKELYAIASSVNLYSVFRKNGRVNNVIQSDDYAPSFLANDVIYLNNPDNPGGPSFKLVSTTQDAEQSQQNQHQHRHTTVDP